MGFRDALYNRRTEREQRRSERKEKRVMKSRFFKFASELYVDDPYSWGQEEFEQVMADSNVEIWRRRRERAIWIFVSACLVIGAMYATWYLKPETPNPRVRWDCNVVVYGDDVPDEVKCEGVQ